MFNTDAGDTLQPLPGNGPSSLEENGSKVEYKEQTDNEALDQSEAPRETEAAFESEAQVDGEADVVEEVEPEFAAEVVPQIEPEVSEVPRTKVSSQHSG